MCLAILSVPDQFSFRLCSMFIASGTGSFLTIDEIGLLTLLYSVKNAVYQGPVGSKLTTSSVNQGPVVQSIVSLTSSSTGQLIKCFTTL